jgi:hypothetical protein
MTLENPTPAGRRRAPLHIREWLLRVVTAAGLGYDAYSHLDLAANYDAITASISQGTLFRVETVLAILAAVAVLLVRRRIVTLAAFLLAAGGLTALLLYRYVDIGAIGPLPNMYEPAWFPEKTWSAISQGVAGVASLILLLRRTTTVPKQSQPPPERP